MSRLRTQDPQGPQDGLPAWLAWALGLVLLLVLVQAGLEVLVLRPGYGLGDETEQVRRLVNLGLGGSFEWRWAQGCLQRWTLGLWLGLAGDSLATLHLPGLAVLALEAWLLWRLAQRWLSPEAAAWAVLADLLCAATWMRARSILAYHWLPCELLALALLSGRVRGRAGAALWGAAGALLLLDYEGALAALPGLLLACLLLEPGLARRRAEALGGFVAAALLVAGLQARTLNEYVHLRAAVNWGEGALALAQAWAVNLGQLLAGGRPMPYLGVEHWPSFAAWALPALALGAWLAWTRGHRALLLWAAFAVLATQAATAPWGLPSNRLAAAWPALCLLAGLGAEGLRRALPRVPVRAWLLLLLLGGAGEANAFYRHMAFHGRQVWGHSELLDAAAQDARKAAAQGASVSTALLETRSADVRFFIGPSLGPGEAWPGGVVPPTAGPRSGAGDELWVFLPPEFHAVASSAGVVHAYRRSPNDAAVLVLVAGRSQALRFAGIEEGLRPLLQAEARGDGDAAEAAWLATPGSDDWAYAAVLQRRLRRLWTGMPLDARTQGFVNARPPLTPAPLALLGRYLASRDPATALACLDRALGADPLWIPALDDRSALLRSQGRPEEADAALDLRAQRLAEGAWMDYE